MRERPILFSATEVRAILDGCKTQTRCVVKNINPALLASNPEPHHIANACRNPYGVVGDRLWVRETWSGIHRYRHIKPSERVSVATPNGPTLREDIWYWADGQPEFGDWEKPRPSIFMPRWASRLTLTITDVRVQRLNEISEEDAEAEGPEPMLWANITPDGMPTRESYQWRAGFHELWDRINGESALWASNPWVWAITFAREVTG